MPLTGLEFAISLTILLGLAVAVVLLNKWRSHAGWVLVIAVLLIIVIGNFPEKSVTGTSPLF